MFKMGEYTAKDSSDVNISVSVNTAELKEDERIIVVENGLPILSECISNSLKEKNFNVSTYVTKGEKIYFIVQTDADSPALKLSSEISYI